MDNILDLGVGTVDRKVIVKAIDEITIAIKDKPSKKAVFKVEQADGKTFNISDVWIETAKGDRIIQGLWINLDDEGSISSTSTLARFLKYNQKDSLREFVGTTIEVYPDPNNFLVFSTCEVEATPENNPKQTNLFD
ncbi:hypothetical protein H8D85_01115 [bacterium]|nr:hypothetical protein [bacterium]